MDPLVVFEMARRQYQTLFLWLTLNLCRINILEDQFAF